MGLLEVRFLSSVSLLDELTTSFNRIPSYIPVGQMKIIDYTKAHRFSLLLAVFGVVCTFWPCTRAPAQRTASTYAALTLEEKVGQMLQILAHTTDSEKDGYEYQLI